jgi:hypothetical protein
LPRARHLFVPTRGIEYNKKKEKEKEKNNNKNNSNK